MHEARKMDPLRPKKHEIAMLRVPPSIDISQVVAYCSQGTLPQFMAKPTVRGPFIDLHFAKEAFDVSDGKAQCPANQETVCTKRNLPAVRPILYAISVFWSADPTTARVVPKSCVLNEVVGNLIAHVFYRSKDAHARSAVGYGCAHRVIHGRFPSC